MSTQQSELNETGMRGQRFEIVEEPAPGLTPANPEFRGISHYIAAFNPGFGYETSEEAYLGYADYRRRVMNESHEPEITYPLQQWLLDSNGALQDLASYGMVRIANYLPRTLTLLRRMEAGTNESYFGQPGKTCSPKSTVDAISNPESPKNGDESTGKMFRVYQVLNGLKVSEPTINGDYDNPTVNCELSMMARRGRTYRIDQPLEETSLVAFATATNAAGDANTDDTGLQVEIESEGATARETITLDPDDATTPVATTATFADIDAIKVTGPDGNAITGDTRADGTRQDFYGNVVVAVNTGGQGGTDGTAPATGEWLSILYGRDAYPEGHGDEGIPTLGESGTRAPPLPTDADGEPDTYYPKNLDIQYPIGDPVGVTGETTIRSMELSPENDISAFPSGSREQIQYDGMRSIEFTVALAGEIVTHEQNRRGLRGDTEDLRIFFDDRGEEYVDLRRCLLTESDQEDEGGEAATERESTFAAQLGIDDGPAIEISAAAPSQ